MIEKDWVLLLLLLIPGAILCAVFDAWRERKAFRRWLKEGRWKFEKFKY